MTLKLPIKLIIGIVLCLGMLVGCGDMDNSNTKKKDTTQISGKVADKDNSNDNDSGRNNQSGLHIGDTGKVETDYSGTFKVTLNSIEMPKNIGDEKPVNDVFVIADVTVENTGDSDVTLEDISKLVDLKDLGGDSGSSPDYADQIKGVENPLSQQGSVAPGKSAEGVLVFDTWSKDKYDFIFGYASQVAMNKVVWTFTPGEAK